MQNDPTYTGSSAGSVASQTPLPAEASTPEYMHHREGEHSHKHLHGGFGFHLHRHKHEDGEQEHAHGPDDAMNEQHSQHDLLHPNQ